MIPLQEAYERCPGLQHFCHSVWSNFSPARGYPGLELQAGKLLPAREELDRELADWTRLGIVPEPDPQHTALVGAIWQSPLFQAIIGAVGFYPPEDLDPRAHLPALYPDLESYSQARLAWGTQVQVIGLHARTNPYWRNVLKLEAPELYLEPYWDRSQPLRGCDLACGWGRIGLALRDYTGLTLDACDLSQSSLDLLTVYAERMGLTPAIRPRRADILGLPFEDESFDFFLAFDIFEHLTNPVLEAALVETLRCGKVGTVMYAEIPLLCFCPAITHVQNWNQPQMRSQVERVEAHGKAWRLIRWDWQIPEQFTFRIVSTVPPPARRRRLDPNTRRLTKTGVGSRESGE